MIEQQIKLLQKQIKKLDEKDFDFLSWKNLSIVLLESIFGKNSEKVNQIQKIEFDQSSWTLRDTSGPSDKINNCKKVGREILEIAILELESRLGLSAPEDSVVYFIVESLKDELTGKQFKKLQSIINSGEKKQDKKNKLIKELKALSPETKVELLAGILTNKELKKYFE